jgi:hypothetical protein
MYLEQRQLHVDYTRFDAMFSVEISMHITFLQGAVGELLLSNAFT